ncbi:MAG: UDP-N-acetylglucosamine 2-epimerase (hydrolyzing) [Candidatus Omnitrophica bacterium]|nr:UDP-N-acetylglucosamine 2-epimerase (hydrolyzing) [Candidatus Omnitrophota bacterium]
MKKKRVCIITGSRAEWGLSYPLAKEIKKNKDAFILQIIATGAHLSRDYGLTYKEIEMDGFRIDNRVNMFLPGDTEEIIAKSVSLGITKLTSTLKSQKPDLVFLLGDRFEIFSAAVACLFLKIPIAHIHGGELTLGSLDDTIRHAITKMAHLHFVSTETYRKRVIQMGETPERVFDVGALGLDNIANTQLVSKVEFEKKLNFKLGQRNILITFNPSTREKKNVSERQFKYLLKAISDLQNTKIIFTNPNADMYSICLRKLIDGYISKNMDRAVTFTSLGRKLYLSALQFMDVVAGNSSSGIIEAPSFSIPTVNIGKRQEGRVKAISVIDANGDPESIRRAFKKAFSISFKKKCKNIVNPYGDGNTAAKIIGIVKRLKLTETKKKFFDLNYNSLIQNRR